MSRRHVTKLVGGAGTAWSVMAVISACGSTTQLAPPPNAFDAAVGTDATVKPSTDAGPTPIDATVSPQDAPGIVVTTDASNCTGKSCQTLGYNCGEAVDNCGKVINCNAGGGDGATCPNANEICGLTAPNKCGTVAGFAADGAISCSPNTCATFGYTCGQMDDGCGNLIDCGGTAACATPAFCGGGGYNQCGTGGGTACVGDAGLCNAIAVCDSGTTTITGTVNAPLPAYLSAGTVGDPVPNVVVYIAQTTPAAFDAGVSCDVCGAEITGNPFGTPVKTTYDGKFTLTNVPAGMKFNLVIQLGRWRKQQTVGPFTACQSTSVGNVLMPRNKAEGDIPLTAVSTGSIDALECVLRKMGVDDGEFTSNTGTGRIQLFSSSADYTSSGGSTSGAGAIAATGTTLRESALTGGLDAGNGLLMNYDQVLFPCWGHAYTKDSKALSNLVNYADHGGHFFATHYSYTWMYKNAEFQNIATWNPEQTDFLADPEPGTVQLPPVNPEGTVFSEWLNLVGALSNGNPTGAVPATPKLDIATPRHDVDAVNDAAVNWIDSTGSTGKNAVMHFTVNTPVIPDAGQPQCGHVIFSDFHVANASASPSDRFPSECEDAGLSPQERVLEYMIWDLASCIPPVTTPTCSPKSCSDLKHKCGPAGDGCGDAIDGGCGVCPTGQICIADDAGGTDCYGPDAGACVPVACPPGQQCGPAPDGCGSIIDCGNCTLPLTCGGGGVVGQCGQQGNK